MDKAIVLVSGGMDSAVALYWAAERYKIAAVMNFDYGQHGADWEQAAATLVLGKLKINQLQLKSELRTVNPHLALMTIRLKIPVRNALTEDMGLDPTVTDIYGQPMTFVPGRNLIFISYATSIAYNIDAQWIIGGWSGMDVDYPDCSDRFLTSAGITASIAIGRGSHGLAIYSPISRASKAGTVVMGEELGVPWEYTRSCYAGDEKPCLACDSCKLRIKAFIAAGVRDPLIDDDDVWEALIDTYSREDAALEGHNEPICE